MFLRTEMVILYNLLFQCIRNIVTNILIFFFLSKTTDFKTIKPFYISIDKTKLISEMRYLRNSKEKYISIYISVIQIELDVRAIRTKYDGGLLNDRAVERELSIVID